MGASIARQSRRVAAVMATAGLVLAACGTAMPSGYPAASAFLTMSLS